MKYTKFVGDPVKDMFLSAIAKKPSVVYCDDCGRAMTRVEIEQRLFNQGRCAACGGQVHGQTSEFYKEDQCPE